MKSGFRFESGSDPCTDSESDLTRTRIHGAFSAVAERPVFRLIEAIVVSANFSVFPILFFCTCIVHCQFASF